jgi:hypothetical protein
LEVLHCENKIDFEERNIWLVMPRNSETPDLNGVTTQKYAFFTVTAVRTPSPKSVLIIVLKIITYNTVGARGSVVG